MSSAWRSKDTQSGTPVNKAGDLVRKKTMPLNVPMIANGIVEGYIVAQFIYLADTQSLKELSVPPDDFINDEAFRALYSGQVDFNLKRSISAWGERSSRTFSWKNSPMCRRATFQDEVIYASAELYCRYEDILVGLQV